MNNMDVYLSGNALYGDDFTFEELQAWYKDEQEGYADLGAKKRPSYQYVYHTLNTRHGFRHIEKRKYKNVLGFGSAYGDEFLPIIKHLERLTIVDPSAAFPAQQVQGVPCEYVKPAIDGRLPFADRAFDLIICLGALHHVPNVTTVMKELSRCLADNGVVLLREPIVSMGDWTKPRAGLTKRERGIPLAILQQIISELRFSVVHQSFCVFPLIPRIYNSLGKAAFNCNVATWVDEKVSKLFSWNVEYHVTTLWGKLRPTSVYVVLKKELGKRTEKRV
jgi:SAM-dependent methyltransferase